MARKAAEAEEVTKSLTSLAAVAATKQPVVRLTSPRSKQDAMKSAQNTPQSRTSKLTQKLKAADLEEEQRGRTDKKEVIAEAGLNFKAIQASEEANEILVSSIKAKLSLLEQISD